MIKFNQAELAALEKRMADITEKVAKKALRTAARKAMNEVRNDAKEAAPVETGLLGKNFAVTTKFKQADLYAKVGIRGGAKENEETPFYFRFVELGTKSIQAKPFLRPALESNASQILDTFIEELRRALDK